MNDGRLQGERRMAGRPAPTRRAGVVVFLGILLTFLGVAGCKNNDLLENELRTRDFQNRDLLDELKKSEFHNESLQREIAAMRLGSKITPEQAAQTFGLKRITLGGLTMGIDHDKVPGDEAIQVVVEPRDVDDHIIKVSGTIKVTAEEISPQGIKYPLAVWDISQDQVRRSWKQGWFGSAGYYFILPWQTCPQYENIRVTVQLVLSDNRPFEADKDIKIHLGPRSTLPQPRPLPDEPPAGSSDSKRSPLDEGMRSTPASSPVRRSNWQAVPLGDSVELGQPELLE